MITCFSSKYITIEFDEGNQILKSVWDTTIDMDDKEYRKTFDAYLERLVEYKPKNVIVNALNANYAIPIETQNYINERVFPLYKQFLTEKMAIIMSTDFIAQLSFEQVVDESVENSTGKLNTKFFDDEEQALEWICYKGNQGKKVA